MTVFVASLMGLEFLSPAHLLWINMITDTAPALALSMEEETLDRGAVPGLTDAQWAALSKGLSPRAKDRFGDLALLREALRGGGAPTVQEPPKKKKRAMLW